MIDRDGIRSKPMPAKWPQNMRIRFDLRACPVRRLMKPLTTRERPELPATTFRKGKEVDAFQVAAARAQDSGEPIPARDRIYIEWLAERFATQPERAQAVVLVPDSVRVESYRSVRLLRRPPGTKRGPLCPMAHATGCPLYGLVGHHRSNGFSGLSYTRRWPPLRLRIRYAAP